MNVIFITIDGARIDRLLKSKSINEIAKNGFKFEKMITYAPYTIAAMHAIVSGEYGFNNGVNSYWSTYNFKKNEYKTLAQYFKDQNYKTYGDAINKLILPFQGFDDLQIHDEDNDDLTIRHKELLNNMKEIEKDNDKFFLYLHYSNIHTNIKNNVLTKCDNFNTEYFQNQKSNEKKYDEYFKEAENYLGDILAHIEKIELSKNTLIVIISDHGISVGDKFGERAYGVFCYDYTIRNYCLFLNEKLQTKSISTQVRSIDILPTILEICNIPIDPNYKKISGESLIPLINENHNLERVAISESGNPLQSGKPPKEPNVVSIRKENFKLIINLHDNSFELYNLSNDPLEENNIHGKNKEIETQMFNQLLTIHPKLSTKLEITSIEEELKKLGYWDQMYSKSDAFGTGATKLATIALEMMKKENCKNIFEIGCGQGRDCIFFAENELNVTAMDFAPKAIEFVEEQRKEKVIENLELFVEDTRKLKFEEKYDCIYSNLALQFFNQNELKDIFDNIATGLESKSLFIFSTKKPGDKYYNSGEKIGEYGFMNKNITRYFFDEDIIRNLLKDNFEIEMIIGNEHINPDNTKSVWWQIISRRL